MKIDSHRLRSAMLPIVKAMLVSHVTRRGARTVCACGVCSLLCCRVWYLVYAAYQISLFLLLNLCPVLPSFPVNSPSSSSSSRPLSAFFHVCITAPSASFCFSLLSLLPPLLVSVFPGVLLSHFHLFPRLCPPPVQEVDKEQVADAWFDAFALMLPHLDKDVIDKEICGMAVNKGDVSQPVASRLMCCKTLGKLAGLMTAAEIER